MPIRFEQMRQRCAALTTIGLACAKGQSANESGSEKTREIDDF
jgi:hypothetical protein